MRADLHTSDAVNLDPGHRRARVLAAHHAHRRGVRVAGSERPEADRRVVRLAELRQRNIDVQWLQQGLEALLEVLADGLALDEDLEPVARQPLCEEF